MTQESKAADPPTAQTVREWKAKAENCFMTSSLDEYCPSEFIELADAYLAILAGPQTMEDVNTAVVPGNVLEAIAHNVCSLHGFDPAFVAGQEAFAKAIITEFLRAMPAPDFALDANGAIAAAPAPLPGGLGGSSSLKGEDTHRATDRPVVGWLIERDDLDQRTLYMCDARGGHGWTPDVHAARRFGAKEEASAWCSGGDADGPLRVAEHSWVNL